MLHNKYFGVMRNFLSDYSRGIYGRELIKKVKMSPKAIALTLKEIEDEGILSSKMKGNIKYYSFNFFNPLVAEQIAFFEKWNALEFFEKHKNLFDFFKNMGGEAVVVFGSYAKGNYSKGSDLDVFVVGKIDSVKLKELAKNYSIKLQVFSNSVSEFRSAVKSKEVLVKEILENHVIIKGADFFVREVVECQKLIGV